MIIDQTTIKFKRGLAADLAELNPVPEDSEFIIEFDTGRFKIGDGIRAWTALNYANITLPINIADVLGLTATLAGKQNAGAYVLDSDARLTDARVPTTHNHVINDITNLQNELDQKQPAGSYALLAAPPSTSTSAGTAGEIAYDSQYVYICVATNTWRRAALSTWT
jgi:hypothetical protein